MTETTEGQQTVEVARSKELIRVPAWEAKYRLSDNPACAPSWRNAA
ncbi:hypothetical protein NG697_00940 [Pseudarthrobacter sp. MDT3-26]|nr:hypothetical protein [Pseudarthrobacter sp. MDT3-26]MCO4261518.1 hypothetical protein [Pseudarthrobacter sp. MDT3-26]